MFRAIRTLPSTVWLLGLVSLCNDTASELIYPLVPIYLASVLLAGPKALGLIEGVAETAGSLLKLFSGVIADRVRRVKFLLVLGYGLAAASRPLMMLASSWPMVLGLRFADRVGKGLRTSPRDAMLAASVPSGQRGLAFGLQRAMDNAGAVIGPLTAAMLLAAGMPVAEIFLWALIPGGVAVVLTLVVREPARELRFDDEALDRNLTTLPSAYRRYLWALALFTLANSSNMFLLLRARELGLPEYQVPLLWGTTSLVATLFSTHLSGLSDRIGRVHMIVAGWTVYALFYLFLGLNGASPFLLWPLFAGYGLFLAATEGAEKALVADFAPPRLLGTAYGWFNLTTGILLLPASWIFGTLWQGVNPQTAFGFAAGCALVAAALLKFWVRGPGSQAGTALFGTACHLAAQSTPLVRRIVSGGQTGADRAALDWAIAHGIDHGGWCPRGRRAEDGIIDARYRLREIASASYRTRTRRNVEDSDGTLILNLGPLEGGTLATRRHAKRLGKPCLVLQLDAREIEDLCRQAIDWLRAHEIGCLNIAGPRESARPGTYATVTLFLDRLAAAGRRL
ncbi:MAG TPA: MFS transporter [Methylococcus sp.]|nr:MFS transporter [Methylococcus sp.]